MDLIGRVQRNVSNEQTIQGNALKLKQSQREEAGMTSLQSKGIENITPDDLMQAGKVKEALDLYNTRRTEIVGRLEHYGKMLSAVNDQPGWDKVRQLAATIHPDAEKEIPAAFDPSVRDAFVGLMRKTVDTMPKYKTGQVEEGDKTLHGYWAEVPGQEPKFITTHTAPRYKPNGGGDSASLAWQKQKYGEEKAGKVQEQDDKILAARKALEKMDARTRSNQIGNSEVTRLTALAEMPTSKEGRGSVSTDVKMSFATEAEAADAWRAGKIKKGDRITIGGRSSTVKR